MNKIKTSFSKIKATEEFKDKLERELLDNPAKSTSGKIKVYHKQTVTAAAIALILLGSIGYKTLVHSFSSSNSNSTAFSPKEEMSQDKEYVINDTQDKNDNKDKDNTSEINNNINTNENKTNLNDTKNNSKSNTVTSGNTTTQNVTEKEATPKIESSTNNDKVEYSNNKNPETKDSSLDFAKNIENSSQEMAHSKNNLETEDRSIFSTTQTLLDNSVYIPKMELPKTSALVSVKMIPLIVYKGKIYTYTSIQIAPEDAKKFLGRKLGTTTGTINEWSSQSDYSTEFASNIGVTDVYSVKGYEEDFRIMTNLTLDNGANYPEFYECLNDITIKNGEDFFGKFNLQGNITNAKFQTFNDWNNSTGTTYQISDNNLLNSFVNGLYKATPYLPEEVESSLGDYMNSDGMKKITIDLKDGCKNITFTVLKSGYVYYEYPRVYFKIDDKLTEDIWDKLGVMGIK